MTQKISILTMVFLALALATAGIGGSVDAHAAPAPASLKKKSLHTPLTHRREVKAKLLA